VQNPTLLEDRRSHRSGINVATIAGQLDEPDKTIRPSGQEDIAFFVRLFM
jgi:hypothetical protein